ncbi:SSI family serine proteinase inhibitor [Streptomyces halobius]|uniref:Subtilase-type protease inhibitor n=1 Tax=Streptomyces halobius TaxID=2879846 RepID=A0ABY4M0G9_9ACTN|nr:SSI family serine proteinase inhibitor [Streptomyces halobius]UQA90952.1 subtilase-type protease inhibitor [Streptomyces halobius]
MPVSRRRRYARATATAAAAVLTTLAAVPAGADAQGMSGGLFLTVSGYGDTWIRGVQLTCPDTGGSHPHGAAACDALTRAGGDMDRLPKAPRPCTKEYDPVSVSAIGTWNGVAVDWRKRFPSPCTLEAATGAVFRF